MPETNSQTVVGPLFCTGHCVKPSTCIFPLIFTVTSWGRDYYRPHFTDEETEGQRTIAACPRPHSLLGVPGSRAQAFNYQVHGSSSELMYTFDPEPLEVENHHGEA